jgi:hypothetical protein
VAHRSPFCRSQTEVGTKQPCLAQQQATTPVTSRFRRLLALAAFTARWFRHEGLYCKRSVTIRARDVSLPTKMGSFTKLKYSWYRLSSTINPRPFVSPTSKSGLRILMWSAWKFPSMVMVRLVSQLGSPVQFAGRFIPGWGQEGQKMVRLPGVVDESW